MENQTSGRKFGLIYMPHLTNEPSRDELPEITLLIHKLITLATGQDTSIYPPSDIIPEYNIDDFIVFGWDKQELMNFLNIEKNPTLRRLTMEVPKICIKDSRDIKD